MDSNVYLIEENLSLQRSLIEFVNWNADLSVCGFAIGHEAVAQILILQPALVITGINLSGTDGISLIRELRHLLPALSILIYSSCSAKYHVNAALAAGAMGFVAKGDPPELMRAIRSILAGEIYLCPRASAAIK